MDGFDPALYDKLTEALNDPYVRVGTINNIKTIPANDIPMAGMPMLSITFTWMEPHEDQHQTPDITAMQLLIPQALARGLPETLAKLTPPQTPPEK